MHLFATLVGCLFGLVLSAFLAAGVVAIRMKTKRVRFANIVGDLLLIVDASVAHFKARALPPEHLSAAAATALKADILAMVREAGAAQIVELVKELRLPEATIDPMLSGLIERAVASSKQAPVAASDQPADQ